MAPADHDMHEMVLPTLGSLSARAETPWIDFTTQHGRVRQRAVAIATGGDLAHSAAVIGVYGSGKSTLLYEILRQSYAGGFLAVYDDAESFFKRIVPGGERLRSDEFVRRAITWIDGLRTGIHLDTLRADLAARGRHDLVRHLPETKARPGARVVLLLDEMEQGHQFISAMVETDDNNPLRSLLDSCNELLAIVIAYAPESFHSLGDADASRLVPLRVPSLTASVICDRLELPRGAANFVWWASRGRARGVIHATANVVRPFRSGQLDNVLDLRQRIADLPRIFGVPAVVRDHLHLDELSRLLDLAPLPADGTDFGLQYSTSGTSPWVHEVERALVNRFGDDLREDVLAVLGELVAVFDGCAAEDGVAHLSLEDLEPAVSLAVARAQEAGAVSLVRDEVVHEITASLRKQGRPMVASAQLPFPLRRLTREVFPSPFTDPTLPIDGKLPSPAALERLYSETERDHTILATWASRSAIVCGNAASLDLWLAHIELSELDRGQNRVLLVSNSSVLGPRAALLVDAGILNVEILKAFSADFVKSAAVALRQAGADDLDDLASVVGDAKDLRRKVGWHLERLDLVVSTLRPRPRVALEQARDEVNERLVPFLQRQISADSPGLLALVPLTAPPSSEGRQRLVMLGEIFSDKRPLRRLTKGSRQLEGAAKVIDQLLPGRTTGSRWVEGRFPALRRFLNQHADPTCVPLLAELLAPGAAGAMEVVLTGQSPEWSGENSESAMKSIAGIGRVHARLNDVHSGLAQLIGGQPDQLASTMSLGDTLNEAVRARKDIEDLGRVLDSLDEVPEMWVRDLITWLVHQFLQVAISQVGNEEATLKGWEVAASRGREVGGRIGMLLGNLDERGWRGLHRRLDAERQQLRGAVHKSPSQLNEAIQELSGRLNGYDQLLSALDRLKEAATRHDLEIRQLLAEYDAREGDPARDAALVREVVDLLEQVGERVPPSSSMDLMVWLGALRDHLAQSRQKRQQGRVAAHLGPLVAERLTGLYDGQIREIEELWPTLPPDFADALRLHLEVDGPTSTDEIAEAVRRAHRKSTQIDAFEESSDLVDLDLRLRNLAVQPTIGSDDLREEGARRAKLLAWLSNQEDRLAPHEILIDVVSNEPSYRAAISASDRFEKRVGPVLLRLTELDALPTQVELEATTGDAYVGELEARRRQADSELRAIEQELATLNTHLLGLGGSQVWARNTSISAHRDAIASAASTLRARLADRQAQAGQAAASLGVQPPAWPDGTWPDRLATLLSVEETLRQVQGLVARCAQLGRPWSTDEPVALDEAVDRVRAAVGAAESMLRQRQEEVQRLRLLGGLSGVTRPSVDLDPIGDVATAESTAAAWRAALTEALAEREKALSAEAQALWRQVQGPQGPEGVLGELLSAGLLIPATSRDDK